MLLRDPLLHLHDPLLVIPPTADGAGLPRHPALVPWCRLVEDDGRVLLEHGGRLVTLEGGAARALLPRLLPLLDGTRTPADITATLGPAIGPAIDNALELLAEHQLLTEGPPAGDGEAGSAATYTAAVTRSTTPTAARDALEAAHVTVLGAGTAADELARQLTKAGVAHIEVLPFEAEPAPARSSSPPPSTPSCRRSCRSTTVRSGAATRGSRCFPTTPFVSQARSSCRERPGVAPASSRGARRPPDSTRTSTSSSASRAERRCPLRSSRWRPLSRRWSPSGG